MIVQPDTFLNQFVLIQAIYTEDTTPDIFEPTKFELAPWHNHEVLKKINITGSSIFVWPLHSDREAVHLSHVDNWGFWKRKEKLQRIHNFVCLNCVRFF